eukprot:evm.model.scf_138.3 EVM.evm.TU.scf_138.3   scf_138:42149-46882(-)
MAYARCLLAAIFGVALLAGDAAGRSILVKDKEGPKESEVPCSTAVAYEIVNSCDWSAEKFPTDYPGDMAHWSPLCGTAHNANYSMWGEGLISTTGVKDVAEAGNHTALQGEVDACIASGNCAWYAEMGCSEFSGTCDHIAKINMTMEYPYVSMISMIAPSPDWITGVSNAKLCGAGGNWIGTYSRELPAFDAGTDGGASYTSEDAPLDPFEPISVFNATDESNIFYNTEKMALFPVCSITFTLKAE